MLDKGIKPFHCLLLLFVRVTVLLTASYKTLRIYTVVSYPRLLQNKYTTIYSYLDVFTYHFLHSKAKHYNGHCS